MTEPRPQPQVPLNAASGAQITLSVLNAATDAPSLQSGVAAKLTVTLKNTGAPVPLTSGMDASALLIYLPVYVTAAELAQATITVPDWQFTVDTVQQALKLTYTGQTPADWQGTLSFEIAQLTAAAAPQDGSLQVNFKHMTGAPPQLITPLPLVKAPVPGHPKLTDMLQVSLDNRGAVYVSDKFDPLANTLFLNIKNSSNEPLYTGKDAPAGALITVEFVYGSTSGALAPATKQERSHKTLGSAWNIKAQRYIDQTQGWRIDPAKSSDPAPIWRITPESGNQTLFGTGAHSNVSFEFYDIVSLTVVGHTQAIVTFTGFMQDETTPYDDMVVVLDMVKLEPPPTRGLLNFFGTGAPVVQVPKAHTAIPIDLRWTMTFVDAVDLVTAFPGVEIASKTYAKPPKPPAALGYDKHSVTLPGISESQSVTMTLQARNAQGAFLNALQYSVYLQLLVFVDPRDNLEYPIALFNNALWMTANLNHDEPGSEVYNNDPKNAPTYGRLYSATSASVTDPPAGWSVPTKAEWDALIAASGPAGRAYTRLTQADEGQFNALLGGEYTPNAPNRKYDNLLKIGYYHMAGSASYAGFVKNAHAEGGTVSTAGRLPNGAAYSLRYIKRL